jgi:rhomboid-like protein
VAWQELSRIARRERWVSALHKNTCPRLILLASGAIYSIVSFFACVYPKATFLIFGIVPCPAWVFVAGIFSYDMYRSVKDVRTRTDTVGHVAGLSSGILYYIWRVRFRGV